MEFKLFIIRHADAGDRVQFKKSGKPDRARPLTAKGKSQAKWVGQTLKRLAAQDAVIVSSPYERTMQTAKIIHKELRAQNPLVSLDELRPGQGLLSLVRWLVHNIKNDMVLVGHEPSLGILLGYLLTSDGGSFFDIKKGTLIQLIVHVRNKKIKAQLQCFLRPSELKKLKKR